MGKIAFFEKILGKIAIFPHSKPNFFRLRRANLPCKINVLGPQNPKIFRLRRAFPLRKYVFSVLICNFFSPAATLFPCKFVQFVQFDDFNKLYKLYTFFSLWGKIAFSEIMLGKIAIWGKIALLRN